jgi:hypothetical protein
VLESPRIAVLLGWLALAAVGLGLTASPARGDADPASDVLISQEIFYPYSPAVSQPLARQLEGLIAAAKTAGFPIKVAMIGDPDDLGGVPNLFAQPQRYATFLGKEISFNRKPPLLVVMPGGYGLYALPRGASKGLKGVDSAGGRGDQLARAAVIAIPKLASATGHRVPAPKPVGGSPRNGAPVFAFLVPVLLLILGGGALAIVNRRRSEPSEGAPT